MKVLTIRQPDATAIVLGLKKSEFRGLSTRYRGPLLIRAASSRAAARDGPGYPGLSADALPCAAILGVVDVVGCVPSEDGCGYEWYLANPRPLPEPVPCKSGSGPLADAPSDFVLPEVLRACPPATSSPP